VKNYLPFVYGWLLNSIVLYLANLCCPVNFVLGTASITRTSAAVLSGFIISIIGWVAKPILAKLKVDLKGRAKTFLFYWAVYSFAIWLTARFSNIFGFGITRFYWALLLGLMLKILHWITRRGLKKANIAQS